MFIRRSFFFFFLVIFVNVFFISSGGRGVSTGFWKTGRYKFYFRSTQDRNVSYSSRFHKCVYVYAVNSILYQTTTNLHIFFFYSIGVIYKRCFLLHSFCSNDRYRCVIFLYTFCGVCVCTGGLFDFIGKIAENIRKRKTIVILRRLGRVGCATILKS